MDWIERFRHDPVLNDMLFSFEGQMSGKGCVSLDSLTGYASDTWELRWFTYELGFYLTRKEIDLSSEGQW